MTLAEMEADRRALLARMEAEQAMGWPREFRVKSEADVRPWFADYVNTIRGYVREGQRVRRAA